MDTNLFEQEHATKSKALQIKVATTDDVLSWSHGEIKTSETINYRTLKPERDGLFCAKIFGPTQDYECNCGKYKRMKHRGITCEKCGVEVISSKVRRERMGHIKLASPVSHIWFLKGVPSRIGTLLDMTMRDLEEILYFKAYIVVNPGSSPFKEREIVDESKYYEFSEQYPDLELGIGAEAIQVLLKNLDIDELHEYLSMDLAEASSEVRRKRIVKRLNIVTYLKESNSAPEAMILEVLPVLPPELRPLVPLEGGRFATSDLNDLYRRVIHRNNRLKRLKDLRAPIIIVKNEQRMLQEAVDALLDNGRRGYPILGSNKRPLKSLSDMLKGKQGRFRQNLLGKRVDYSGRTVIVVGPDMKLHQCGLPKKMALELFKPFIYHRLIDNDKVTSIKQAKQLLENNAPEVWDILEKVIIDHPILLNRAPTLHRLGIQAFEPVLIEGKAIQLHPLVCTAFNADFDGDQMAVHVPLSIEAQLEAKILIMSTNNLLSPANGKPLMSPSQDIVLGMYWITTEQDDLIGHGKCFANFDQVSAAYDHQKVELHTKIKVRMDGQLTETTVGRILLFQIIPPEIPFSLVNRQLNKKRLGNLIDMVYRQVGSVRTVKLLDDIKALGYRYATTAGFSISMADMVSPPTKAELLKAAQEEVNKVNIEYHNGIITDGERYNQVIDVWARVTDKVAEEMTKAIQKPTMEDGKRVFNSIYMMADSGARGSQQQMKQLAGMRGLMAKPSGEIIETPITANFREGLNVLQYFISTHGARKGLADTALKTANSGYLTRRLVDIAQDCVILEHDCGTLDGIEMTALIEAGEIVETLGERILGRISQEDIPDPDNSGSYIIRTSEEITETVVEQIEKAGVERINIRSALTCINDHGICQLCYGRDLSHGRIINLGEAVGVIAAQSIGEPGTQLTMRTFHIGGAASRLAEQNTWEPRFSGILKFENLKEVRNKDNQYVVSGRRGSALIVDEQGREKDRHPLPIGAVLLKEEGVHISQGERVAEWDPFSIPILTDISGFVKFKDIDENETIKEQVDEATGLARQVIQESANPEKRPHILIRDDSGKVLKNQNDAPAKFSLPTKAELVVVDGQEVHAGSILAKIPRELAKNKDITGGLPRVAELFEARVPKDHAIISEIDGEVVFGKDIKKKQRILIKPEDEKGESKEYLIPLGRHITVQEGEYVRAGEPLIDGSPNPHDILAVKGAKELQKYLVDEVQEVYRLQGVDINDKHIEVIVRQMLKQVSIQSPGESPLLIGQVISRVQFNQMNRELREQGKEQAVSKPILLGITKASLSTDSFISAASFQETTKILTDAALGGKYDTFRGLKENVILGRLIPAGTGFQQFQDVQYHLKEKKDAVPQTQLEKAEV